MKFLIRTLFATFLATASMLNVAASDEFKELYESKRYFDLRDRLSSTDAGVPTIEFYRAAVDNKFNRPGSAIKRLKKFLASRAASQDARLQREAYTLLADSYVKSYLYSEAAKTYEQILAKFSTSMTGVEVASFRNVLGLWKGLESVPPQKTVFRGDSKIAGKQERVGLMVPIEIGGHTESMIFDTGANLSTIIESEAVRLGLQIIDAPFDVGSITGNSVKARIGVAKRLKFGNVEFQNVAFIVFPDKALYIEPIKYQIKGIIGYPVINALREITITNDKQISVPAKPSKLTLNNLAIDGLTPLILGTHDARRLTFSFDTGARTSSLYPPFFKAFESEITSAGKQITASVTGAGGSRKVNAYKVENLVIEFGGKKPVFTSIEVFTEETTMSSRTLYGNIGRDMIDQHDRMTISFASMSVVFD